MTNLKSAAVMLALAVLAQVAHSQDIAVTTMTFRSLTDFQASDPHSGTVFKPCVPGEGIIYTFTIRNTATVGDLVLSLPITVTGAHPGDFIVGQPSAATIGPGGSRTFTINWHPLANGDRTGTVNITSNDPDAESTFTFGVAGLRYNGVTLDYPDLEVEPVSDDPVYSKFRKSTASQTVKVKVGVSNDRSYPMETGYLHVFKSSLPYLLSTDDPILEVPLKPLPGPTATHPGRIKKYKMKADVGDMTSGFIFVKVVPVGPSPTEWHWSDNVIRFPFAPKP